MAQIMPKLSSFLAAAVLTALVAMPNAQAVTIASLAPGLTISADISVSDTADVLGVSTSALEVLAGSLVIGGAPSLPFDIAGTKDRAAFLSDLDDGLSGGAGLSGAGPTEAIVTAAFGMLIDNSAGSGAVTVTLNLGGFAVIGTVGTGSGALASMVFEGFSRDAAAGSALPLNFLIVDEVFDIFVDIGDSVGVSGEFTMSAAALEPTDGFLSEGSFGLFVSDVTAASAVPEPGALVLFSVGLVGLGALRRKRLGAGRA